MPPRRSTRTPSAPTPAPAPSASSGGKRRRTVIKEEVAEDQHDASASPPVAPTTDEDDDDDDPETSPRPAKRSRAKGPVKSRKKKVVKEESDDEEEEEVSKRKKKAPPPRRKNGKRMVQSSEGEEEGGGSDHTVQQEDVQPPAPSQSKPARNDTIDTFTVPKRSPAKANKRKVSAGQSPNKTPAARKHAPRDEEEEDPDDIPSFSPSKTPRKKEKEREKARQEAEESEEEEEEDLFEAIRRGQSTQPPGTPRRSAGRGLSLQPGGGGAATAVPSTQQAEESAASAAPPIPEGPKSRLVIHKLVLLNFKSYAGRQIIGPFHKSFSAIVGPNGSGKSNTIDALLFVFGYRASKMRQGKLSELIHNSAEHPDLDECRVEVWFREIEDLPGPDAFKVVPDSKLVVARSAFRNNSSTYTINNEKSSFKEVTTLLKQRGIDLDHKRFLILQGEVESIAQMKPKAANEHEDGLLEYLEDIIGTSQYKQPIEEAMLEVDRLNEERSEKLNRLKLIEKDKAALEEKKKEAEQYLRNKNDLVRARNKLWQFYILGHTRLAQQHEVEIEELREELEAEKAKNKSNIEEYEKQEKAYEERVALFEVVKKETAPLIKQLHDLEKQDVKLQEQRKHLMAKGKKLTKAQKEDMSSRSEKTQLIKDNAEAIEGLKEEIEDLEKELEKEEAELEKITDSLKDKTEHFHVKIEAKQKELEPWSTKINKKQAELDLATNERNMLTEKAKAVQDQIQEAETTFNNLTAEKESKESQLQELKAELAKLKKDLAGKEKKLQAYDEQEQKLRSKASSARQKTEEAKASQAASNSQNRVLESLNRLKTSGRLTGFHGRLGDLGAINDKYDVAISTACPALNNLVVDQVKQGETCLQYLKQQNVGRANIYVLEKLGGQIPRVNTPENAPRLFDLITPKDPKFAPAFYKAVRDTLVADNLEQANRLAFGPGRRWRVVTLDGKLIDTSGTMSGGGTKVSRGLMSSKFAAEVVRPETVRQYEDEAEAAAKALDDFMVEKRAFLQEAEEVRSKIPNLEMDISKVELDIRGGEKRIENARKRIKELQTQNKPDAGDVKRIATLDAKIAAASREVDDLQQHASAIQEEIQALQAKILEIGGTRLRAQKDKVNGKKAMIDTKTTMLTKAEVDKAKAEKDVEKLEVAIAAAEEQATQLRDDVIALDSESKTCQEVIDDLKGRVEEAQDVLGQHTDIIKEMKAELDGKQEEINGFRRKETTIKNNLEDHRKKSAEENSKRKNVQDRLKKLKLDDVDEDDDDEEDAQKPSEEGADAMEVDPPVKQEDGESRPTPPPAPRKQNPYELQIYTDEELEAMNNATLQGEVAKLEGLVGEGVPNMKALEEYRRREADFLKRAKDLDEVTAARDEMKKRHDDLRKTRLEEFMTGFNAISSKLKEMYQMITLGGNAELELVDSMDPFSEGIIFSVMPPKKSWKNISNLSGGEKTLSSLALVFALHVFKPTPLYFMDEIDAALDFRNVSIVANYIKDRTKNAQFIIISLRNDMFELSHRLIGIYKTSNATRSISIDNKPLKAQTSKA